MFHYYQLNGGEEAWKPAPASHIEHIRTEHKPVFTSVLQVNRLVEDLAYEDKLKLKYLGPLYFDFDSKNEDISEVISQVNLFIDKLVEMQVDFEMVYFFISGSKGFHIEIPIECVIPKVPKDGIQSLPTIYREMALELCVDKLDMTVYSQGRGRMWREPNVQRANGKYKVAVTLKEIREMSVENYQTLCSAPRILPKRKAPQLCLDLAMLYERSYQKVVEKIKKRGKVKRDPFAKAKAACASIGFMMMGEGIKDTAGFNDVALQLGIAAHTAGLKLEEFLTNCAGLIESANLTWNRYNTPGKRRDQLSAMYHYTQENICYEFSVGAIKSLLFHTAPDLDGIETNKEDVAEGIKESSQELKGEIDEYADVASGVALSKFGTYVDTEHGKKRVCAVSFANTTILKSAETGDHACYETDVLVNGKRICRSTLELDVFSSVQQYNKFCARLGHAFQGTDPQIRGLMMRFVEQAKKKGESKYIAKREGLDVVNIPNHPDEELREPFLIWADPSGVKIDPRVAGKVEMSFQGFPDPRGLFKTDIEDSPDLTEWIEDPSHKLEMKAMLQNLMTCQRPELLGKLIGWYISTFWRQMFHRVYGQYPSLHVNGSPGAGKTSMNISLMALFYRNNEVKTLSPAATIFAIQQHMAASASIPMIIDEYKPWNLPRERVHQFELLIRDSYNCRDVMKGGGTRENDDYRSLHHTQLAAPLAFISEAMAEDAALMERVVLVTMVKPPASVSMKWLSRYTAFRKDRQYLSMIGSWIGGDIVEYWTLERLRKEFDDLYAVVREKYMVNDADLASKNEEVLRQKQNIKERSVYNHCVAQFGFKQFRKIVNSLIGNSLDELMGTLEDGIYDRLSDLVAATTPDYIKVLAEISMMSYHVADDRQEAIREGFEYAHLRVDGKDALELTVRNTYQRYRIYCKSSGRLPLFSGAEQFAYALKDCPAMLKRGLGTRLSVPDVYTFDATELQHLGVEIFQ